METTLHLGQTLAFHANPFQRGLEAVDYQQHGAVLVRDGLIVGVGPADKLRDGYTGSVVDHGKGLIVPGFIDAHAHASQTAMIARWGKRLIDWLNDYTFPEEMRFADPNYAKSIAERYLDLCLSYGTTTAASFCTSHTASVDALMTAAEARGLRWIAGRVMMDRNAPEGLCDTAQSAFDICESLIRRWHGRGRLSYAITPRFAPTSTPAQLEAAGALWAAHPQCPMQTHLSEQREEIAWVSELVPEARDYVDVYQRHGLLGPGALMGHAIHLEAREWTAIAETGTSLVHCPTSNSFLGSGLFAMAHAQAAHIPVGLATDVGAGSSFSMLRTMAAAYEIGQLGGRALHPSELLWLATGGSAEALRLQDRIGRLEAGLEADLIVLDLASTPAIAQRAAEAEDIWQAVFPTIMMGDDRAIAAVYVAGKAVSNPL